MSDKPPPLEILSSDDFSSIGLPFPLFEAPIRDAREYAGPGTCSLCLTEGAQCFSLEDGTELIAECPGCLEEVPLLVSDRADRPCPRCGESVPFTLPRTGRLKVCYECLQAGLAALGRASEQGWIGWAGAMDPDQAHQRRRLLELLRTPRPGGGSPWLFCCGEPMVYTGSWSAGRFVRSIQVGSGERLFSEALGGAGSWEALNRGEGEALMYRCEACGRMRGSWESEE